MKSYTVSFPLTRDMSPISYLVRDTLTQTKEEDALWHYNSSREHDGLPPLDNLPKGTRFKAITEQEVA